MKPSGNAGGWPVVMVGVVSIIIFWWLLRGGAVIGTESTDEEFEGGFSQHIRDAAFQIRGGIGPACFNPRDFDFLEADQLRKLELRHAFQHPRRLQSVIRCHNRFVVAVVNHFATSNQ